MANLSEVLLRKRGQGTLRTGVGAIDEDLASVHAFSTAALGGSCGSPAPRAKAAPGIPECSITELSGLPGSGKTALALALILDTVRRGLGVLYIGCDYRSFPWERQTAMQGWDANRFDSRVHTLYIHSLEQLLTLRNPENTGLVVVEHYDTLIKRSWSADLCRRAADACIAKLQSLSNSSCVLVTAGCVKTQLHDLIVPAPAMKVWSRPANMARLVLYKDYEHNYVLSTGSYFRIDGHGLVSSLNNEPKPVLQLPMLSSKKTQYGKQPRHSDFSESVAPYGLPTPSSKRIKLLLSGDTAAYRTHSSRDSEPPSSPSDHKNKPPLSSSESHTRAAPILSPTSVHTEPSDSGYRTSRMHKLLLGRAERAEPSHSDAPLTHDHPSDLPNPTSREASPAPPPQSAARGESFLGLEIVPNSQVEADDPEYLLQRSMP